MKIRNVHQVAQHRLCLGCGACVDACPEKKVHLVDMIADGIRPIVASEDECGRCRQCLEVCPGYNINAIPRKVNENGIKSLAKRWGTILELWEGYAADPEIRYNGSSGGLCSALSLFCVEKGYAGGVLHIGSDTDMPWKNKTYLSTTREEIAARAGSRYAPASPCDGLHQIERSLKPVVFVGKPCDVAGLRMSGAIAPMLAQKTALALGFFCAGTPSTHGTLELLKTNGIDPDQVEKMRYRGMGWPGLASVWKKGQELPSLQLSYQNSWGFVQKYRPFRCYLCPDLTAEFADISVGDPWYRGLGDDDPGRSLILIRTERGREIFHSAMKNGYVTAERADPRTLYQSQKNLLGKRQTIWGRLLAMKLLGISRPRLKGFYLFANWLDLSIGEKLKSILGTVRRIIQRNYFRPIEYAQTNRSGAKSGVRQ